MGAPKEESEFHHERDQTDQCLSAERTITDELLARVSAAGEQDSSSEAFIKDRQTTDRSLLRERSRMDEAMAAYQDVSTVVWHDCKTLIDSIAMATQMIGRSLPAGKEGEPIRELVTIIEQSVTAMKRLNAELLMSGRIDSGRLSIQPVASDLRIDVQDAVEEQRPAALAKKISLVTLTSSQPVSAWYDRTRIRQVMASLISNAVKFTPPFGKIEVSVEREKDRARVTVCDTGPGISEKVRAPIFDRFSQIGTAAGDSLGLGLYIARKIVMAHGGEIWADKRKGGGSEFHFTLPLQRPIRVSTE